MGFQATAFGLAVKQVNEMIKWRLSDEPVAHDEEEHLKDPEARKDVRCTIFLGYASNLVSGGVREIIRYLAQHKMIDCIVTTTGGIEEDFMKCFGNFYVGEFSLIGKDLRAKGLNRQGDLIVPNNNYNLLEDWFKVLVREMHQEQK